MAVVIKTNLDIAEEAGELITKVYNSIDVILFSVIDHATHETHDFSVQLNNKRRIERINELKDELLDQADASDTTESMVRTCADTMRKIMDNFVEIGDTLKGDLFIDNRKELLTSVLYIETAFRKLEAFSLALGGTNWQQWALDNLVSDPLGFIAASDVLDFLNRRAPRGVRVDRKKAAAFMKYLGAAPTVKDIKGKTTRGYLGVKLKGT